ncbi:MAG: substrate-binding domain-containing protein [Synechococcaceae cyanobacterium]
MDWFPRRDAVSASRPAFTRRRLISLGLATTALVLAAAPLPGLRRTLLVSVGSELEESFRRLEPAFERQEGAIDLRWQVEGSQDMVNNNLEARTERPRVLIPADQDLLKQFAARVSALGQPPPFTAGPTPIARTRLVALAWPERAQRLFAAGRFSWRRLREAVAAGQWGALGGPAAWGSFDLRATDPLRSNSGQLLLALWSQGPGDQTSFQALRRAIYRPARSTDILLREFISGGPNEGDLAFVYEAGARQRAAEAAQRWPGGYRLLLPDPSIEVVPAAAVLKGAASGRPEDGERLVAFLTGPSGQEILRGAGYRQASDQVQGRDSQGIRLLPPPSQSEREELLRRWQRAGD